MRRSLPIVASLIGPLLAGAQSYTTSDATIRRLFDEGMNRSQAGQLLQVLSDSIGPRLTGSPGIKNGNDWLVSRYRSWGVDAKNEQYGTWKGWRRGVTHIDLIAPRVRSLEGMMLAWSGGTGNQAVEGDVVILPDVPDSSAFAQWLPQARGKFVLISMLQPTCRPDDNWERFATPESFAQLKVRRTEETASWNGRIQRTGLGVGLGTGSLGSRLEAAGAAGIIASRWSNGWGVQKVFSSGTERIPSIDISCEDYGLVYRLAANNQGPRLRVRADAEFTGEVPAFNTIARIPGTAKPDEYVVLSAHFDSWDGGSGTTDNGTGTITMMEAMRLLKLHYPSPKRTIIVGHWGGEEQGLNGSRGWAEDHPEVVQGLQALFNQDNGTGRVANLGGAGLTTASGNLARWMANVPTDIARHVTMTFPGSPAGGGSDNASFSCYGAPAYGLGALEWSYGTYTWHTQRDTYDKAVLDDLKNNATLAAMLVYLASEDPEKLSRDQRSFDRGPQAPAAQAGPGGGGPPGGGRWPACTKAARSSAGYRR
jgi:hypothetical protein